GVCMATSGPGATNLVTGIATAFLDSVPLVAITGQVSTSMVGTDAFQEVDITGITLPITKHNYLITDPEEIAEVVEEAFYLASSGRPGPVLIDIPQNVALALCSGDAPESLHLPGYKPTYKGNGSQIKSACTALSEAKRPLIYSGGGVNSAKAYEAVLSLAEKLQAGVVTSLMGKGSFPEDHPQYLGMVGVHGHPAANLALCEADVLLVLGGRFADRTTGAASKFGKQTTIIHVDIDPAEIGKNISFRIPIVGEISLVLDAMLERLSQSENPEWLSRLATLRTHNDFVTARSCEGEVLTSRYIVDLLNELTDDKALVTTDVGQHQMTAAQYYRNAYGGRFLTSGGLGTMGYGLPAALGAQAASPESKVICITGDGSLQMSLNEMATIKAEGMPVKILLFNNESLSMVRQLEKYYYEERYYAVDMPGNPDFVKLAEAYGFESYRITSCEGAKETLAKALASPNAALIECITDKDDMVLPIIKGGCGLDEMIFE
ncbi:MAG: biosynthetic-type acetolactate synthase large subunit, partial [Clostridiales bacterium]|nr:biosynthetic-type acetolactate synthase large subunit [Clostridiales bacterium]